MRRTRSMARRRPLAYSRLCIDSFLQKGTVRSLLDVVFGYFEALGLTSLRSTFCNAPLTSSFAVLSSSKKAALACHLNSWFLASASSY